MKIIYAPKFERSYRKLPQATKREAQKKEKIFRIDPRDPRLKTHKLKGKLGDYWSFSVTYSYRIIFVFANKKEVYFLDIGDHDVYK